MEGRETHKAAALKDGPRSVGSAVNPQPVFPRIGFSGLICGRVPASRGEDKIWEISSAPTCQPNPLGGTLRIPRFLLEFVPRDETWPFISSKTEQK